MRFTILDCYTDEPAGLGVPPFIGTYPRYIYGALKNKKQEVSYVTIDDLRKLDNARELKRKTNIKQYNFSKNKDVSKILDKTDVLVIIAGVHTPGKYLSAVPGTVAEVSKLVSKFKCFKVLTGPAAACSSGLYGGKVAKEINQMNFDLVVSDFEYKVGELLDNKFTSDCDVDVSYSSISQIAVLGAELLKFHPGRIIELETSKGCSRKKGCSFCTEPLKYCGIQRRDAKDIVAEVKALSKYCKNFRLGKQSCMYSYGSNFELQKLLSGVSKYSSILHIDNANPVMVTADKTKTIVKYCSAGNVAAFGQESFDKDVIKKNNLNSMPEDTMKAIEIINKYGSARGVNGMPKFLPGINLLFGLIGETKKTHEHNMMWLNEIYERGLMLRRINIRQVVAFPGTMIYEKAKNKFVKKNKKYYWKWRHEIREKIDWPMLKRLVPVGTLLRDVYMEVHDGNTTFGRQLGTYPLIVGVKKKLKIDSIYDIRVIDHMLRSVVGEVKQ